MATQLVGTNINTAPAPPLTIGTINAGLAKNYEVLGALGTTTQNPKFSANPWRGFSFIRDLKCNSHGCFAAQGFAENSENYVSFKENAYNARNGIHGSIHTEAYANATNGTLSYLVLNNNNQDRHNQSYVVAYNCSNDVQYQFPAGVDVIDGLPKVTAYHTFDIDDVPGREAYQVQWNIIGIASEQGSNKLLAVSRKNQNKIYFYNNTTGAYIAEFNITLPERMDFMTNGDLWVISDSNKVVILKQNGTSTNPSFAVVNTLTQFSEPSSITAEGDGGASIIDAGTSHQIKRVNASGTTISTFPNEVGGNTLYSDVTFSRFLFLNKDPLSGHQYPGGLYKRKQSALAISPDGSRWVLDPGNYRVIHYNQDYTNVLGMIQFLPDFFIIAVDLNDTKRVHGEFMEFEVNWDKGLQSGDQTKLAEPTFVLKKNWSAGLPHNIQPFHSVITYTKNGRTTTCAMAQDYDYNPSGAYKKQMVILPPTGNAFLTGRIFNFEPGTGRNENLYPEGLRTWYRVNGSRLQTWEANILDVDNQTPAQPVFEELHVVIDFEADPEGTNGFPFPDPGWNRQFECPMTPNGMRWAFRTGREAHDCYHLGGIKPGSTTWDVLELPNTIIGMAGINKGFYPNSFSGPAFGGHQGVTVLGTGKSVVVVYDGQFSEYVTNQHWHYNQDGKFVGQFGRKNDVDLDFRSFNLAPHGYANNTGYAFMFSRGNDAYISQTDENGSGGFLTHKLINHERPVVNDQFTHAVLPQPLSSTFTYEAADPTIIGQGGLIENRNFSASVIVNVPTGELVEFKNCVFRSVTQADMIEVQAGARVKVTNSRFYAEASLNVGLAHSKALNAVNPRHIEFTNNYLEGTSGIRVIGWATTGITEKDTVKIKQNRVLNIRGADSQSTGTAFVHLQDLYRPFAEVVLNQVHNVHRQSAMLDGIRIINAGGIKFHDMLIEDNFFKGLYRPYEGADFNPHGIFIATTSNNSPTYPRYIGVRRNIITSFTNVGMEIVAGRNITVYNNVLRASGELVGGGTHDLPWRGILLNKQFAEQNAENFRDIRMEENDVWVNGIPFYELPEGTDLGPNVTLLITNHESNKNRYRTNPTYAQEAHMFDVIWKTKIIALRKKVGVI
jgi:hypothetical protein